MSVLIDPRNLILGNGDLFLATSVASLPSLTAYKAALTGGTLPTLAGNVGAIKGTATIQIVRELAQFEVGVPQEVGDQTVIREGVHFKCALAELSLATVQKQIGGGIYSTLTSTVVHVTGESHTIPSVDAVIPFSKGPVILTTSTPAATADPVLTLDPTGVGAATVPYTLTATGTGTLSGGSGSFSSTLTSLTVGGTAAATQVYTIKFGTGPGQKTVSYTATGGDTNTTIATNLFNAVNGATGTGRVVSPFVASAFLATNPSAGVVGVTMIAFLEDYDYGVDLTTNSFFALNSANLPASTAVLMDYYINQFAQEKLTGGGQADVTTSALRFFHPFKDGRVLQLTIFKANPSGGITLPFEEIAYSHAELEMRGIADFSRGAGDHLYELVRELPT